MQSAASRETLAVAARETLGVAARETLGVAARETLGVAARGTAPSPALPCATAFVCCAPRLPPYRP